MEGNSDVLLIKAKMVWPVKFAFEDFFLTQLLCFGLLFPILIMQELKWDLDVFLYATLMNTGHSLLSLCQ